MTDMSAEANGRESVTAAGLRIERLDIETAEQGRPDIERMPEDDGEVVIERE
jgi:hypothetical protein